MKHLPRLFWLAAVIVSVVGFWVMRLSWQCWLFPDSLKDLITSNEEADYQVASPIVQTYTYSDASTAADDSMTMISATAADQSVVVPEIKPLTPTWQESVMPAYRGCLAGESSQNQILFWAGAGAALLIIIDVAWSIIMIVRRKMRSR